MTFRKTSLSSALALAALSLVACGGGGDGDGGSGILQPAPPVAVGDTIALTASGKLISFNRAAPGTAVGSVTISGLAANETLVGIDVRPADNQLYGVGSAGTLYVLDAATGGATAKTTLKAAPGDDNPFAALAGTAFGVDFNPAADRLRVVSNSGQNLRINVDTGEATTDSVLPATSAVSAVAYTNSFNGASVTQLFDLDVTAGRLFLQDPPNNGTLNAGVPLGVTADAVNGFDIDARNNTGYAALRVGAETVLYSINLAATADAATRVGPIAGGETIRGLALAATRAPTAIGLAADNRLVAFDPKAPNTLTATTAVTGLGAGEILVGMDFRPKDGLLYGVTRSGRLYTINPDTGAATLRAALAADPTDTTAPFAGLTGPGGFSVDFNPAADRLRVIGSDGQNLRIVVETATAGGVTVTAGATTTDTAINRASGAPVVAASAYTNSFAGATATALHNLEQTTDQFTLQNPPNNGTLTDIGALGIDITGAGGFDIAGGGNGLVLAALRSGAAGPFSLYTISLTTGAATLYRNTSGNTALSLIGGASGPANLVDLAIRF
jgi:Domain of unknown function (DUF4394)